jgi:hypothetical protein
MKVGIEREDRSSNVTTTSDFAETSIRDSNLRLRRLRGKKAGATVL